MKLRQPGCSTAARDLQQTCEKQCGQCWRQRASATNGSLQRICCGDTPDRPTDQTKSHNEPDGYLDGDALLVVARRPHLEAGCTAPGRFEEDRSGAVVAFRGSCPERKEELME